MSVKKLPPETRLAFAKRLEALRRAKQWNQAELARAAAIHMPDGKFGRDSISKYENGTHAPHPIQLDALAKALGVPAEDLLPSTAGIAAAMDLGGNPYTIRPDGTWHLRINESLPPELGLKIYTMIQQHKDAAKRGR